MKEGDIVCWQLNGDKGGIKISDFHFIGVLFPDDELFTPLCYWRIKTLKK